MAIACAWKNAGAGGRFPSAFQCNTRGFLEKSAIFSDRRPGRVKFATSDDVPMEARRDMNMSWPFARTRRESKAALPLVALSQPQLGAPAWGRRDAAALMQDGYLRNAVAYRYVRMVADVEALAQLRGLAPGPLAPPVPEFGEVDLVVIDGPRLPGAAGASGPLVAAWADPWPGEVGVLAGLAADVIRERAVLAQPAVIGRLVEAAGAGPVGRWDRAIVLRVYSPGDAFASLPEALVLGGGNAALLETDAGWELIQFASAELVDVDTWLLRGLLRGQRGSVSAAAEAGARVVLLDEAVVCASISSGEVELAVDWRTAGGEVAATLAFENMAGLPLSVAHLRRSGDQLQWTRRGAEVAGSWTFLEAANDGRFAVEVDEGSGFEGRFDVGVPEATLPGGATAARVAEIGADGRTGPWVSIGPGTP
jgi:hypothetical protein